MRGKRPRTLREPSRQQEKSDSCCWKHHANRWRILNHSRQSAKDGNSSLTAAVVVGRGVEGVEGFVLNARCLWTNVITYK